MKYYIFIILLFVVFSRSVLAQNKTSPWKITVGINAIEVDPVGSSSKDTETQISPNVSYLEVSRYLGAGFSLDLAGSLNSLERTSGAEDLYYGIDLGTSLSANQIIDLGKFEPTVRLGVGLSGGLSGFSSLGDDFFNVYGGLGLNYWLNDAVALTLRSTVKSYIKEFDDLVGNGDGGLGHLQHAAGLSFAFGKENDADKDGVSDEEDACPDVPGIESQNGCPDDDGDGIRNNIDDCPLTAGTAALNGCPDADGDGIKDADDRCPNNAGAASLKGCPDADGDGIADANDECPREAGLSSNNGCPEAVPETPKKPEVKIPEYPLSLLNGFTIYFDSDKHDTDSLYDLKRSLSTVINVLTANSETNVTIEGHTDSTGSATYNKSLSEKRAKYVKKHLIGGGINASRLSTKSFGETSPMATNTTKEGRAANRRVVIKVKK
ncbi:MAG: OmpA family protein [Flavobacteriaceae bacterium]